MSSPPRTPSPTPAKISQNFRFVHRWGDYESAEDYRPGGYHPIELGDTFKDGQYRVLRKIAVGEPSTIWLAKDEQNKRFVALKVCESRPNKEVDNETSHLKSIRDSIDPLKKHVQTMLDEFTHSGVNGIHKCLVYELMGPSVTKMLWLSPLPSVCGERYLPKQTSRMILKDVLKGLAFLHRQNIVHADVRLGNVVFSISNVDDVDEKDLQQVIRIYDPNEPFNTKYIQDTLVPKTYDADHPLAGVEITSFGRGITMHPVAPERLDGKEDKWAPKTLYPFQPLVDYAEWRKDKALFRLVDFGRAFHTDDPPTTGFARPGLRAPEYIFKEKLGAGIDIWAFGCLVYELFTTKRLFYVENINEDQLDDRDDNDVLLIDLNECLDPLPDDWLTEEKWPRVFEYFDSNGKLKEGVYQSPYPTEPYELYHAPLPISLEERFEKNKIKEITPDEAKTITQLVRSILKYDPNERPTAEELLNHPFFQDEKADGEKEASE